ncbi:MAG TPA: hypothetical protein VN851_10020 [Thermoanaerobaculia bacterium]|nr:hypothetical protein [Thermoanaerobaculia bacterium]
MSDRILSLLPYAVAFFLALSDAPSFFIGRRHKGSVSEAELRFASRFSSVAEVAALPLLTFVYSLVSISRSVSRGAQNGMAIVSFAAVAFMIFLLLSAYFLVTTDLSNELDLPRWKTRGGRELLSFEGVLRLLKGIGVAISALATLLADSQLG